MERLEKGSRKTPYQQVMSKLDRRNRAKQLRLAKDQQNAKATSVFSGRNGAPRIVAVVPLCEQVSVVEAIRSLNASVEAQRPADGDYTSIERFKQRIQYMPVARDLLRAMDACRIADFVVFVLSCHEEVDEYGELVLRAVESQGLSNTFAVAQGLARLDSPKHRPQVVSSLKSYISHFLPSTEKVFSLDNLQETSNLMRSLCTTVPKGVKWRDQRSYMAIENVHWSRVDQVAAANDTTQVILTGVVRGHGLKADRLVQIGDWGDFQIEKITAAALETTDRKEGNMTDGSPHEQVLETPSIDQDDLVGLAPEEVIMDDADEHATSAPPSEGKGVLLDNHRHLSTEDDELAMSFHSKRVPKGTSKYQSAWYLDNVSDSGSDLEDLEDDLPSAVDGDMMDIDDCMSDAALSQAVPTGSDPSEYPQSELLEDRSPEDEAAELSAHRRAKREAEDDAEFPDEIELPPHICARERLARYRGLRSFQRSPWETEEDRFHEPSEWRRLLEISGYRSSASKTVREAVAGGVKPGTRVHVHVRNVPVALAQTSTPVALFSLLRHEHKQTACNYSIKLDSSHPDPIQSKTELIVQCGPRRMLVKPASLHQ